MGIFSLKDKVAIVTGGGSGIGQSISEAFAKAEAEVHILDIDLSSAEKVAEEIAQAGGKAQAHQADVSSQSAMVDLINGIAKKSGRIDIMVGNAGVAHVGVLETTSEEDFDRLVSVNVKGVYNTMFAVVPHMKAQNYGVILNMASVASELGIPDRFAYSMSKAAVLNMTLTVAKDYVGHGIRANAISPGRVHTPFVDGFLAKNYPGQEEEMYDKLSKTQPIGRMGKPQEIAHLAQFLCSDEAGFITGSNYYIDGGFQKLNT